MRLQPLMLVLALAGALGFAVPACANNFANNANATAVLQQWDLNHDGMLEWSEARQAAIARFKALDASGDGRLEAKEVWPLGPAMVAAVQASPGQSLTLDQYLRLVRERFMAADADHDGALTKQELESPAGQALIPFLEFSAG